jgi:hypothetical protein
MNWEGSGYDYLNVIFEDLLGTSEEDQERFQSVRLLSLPEFEPGTF